MSNRTTKQSQKPIFIRVSASQNMFASLEAAYTGCQKEAISQSISAADQLFLRVAEIEKWIEGQAA